MPPCTHADSEHPDAVTWNPGNNAVQCHRCGQVFHARTVAEADYAQAVAACDRLIKAYGNLNTHLGHSSICDCGLNEAADVLLKAWP